MNMMNEFGTDNILYDITVNFETLATEDEGRSSQHVQVGSHPLSERVDDPAISPVRNLQIPLRKTCSMPMIISACRNTLTLFRPELTVTLVALGREPILG